MGRVPLYSKKAHEQWAKCQYYKKQCWDKSSDVTKVYTRPPDEPLILVSNSRTVSFLKEEYYIDNMDLFGDLVGVNELDNFSFNDLVDIKKGLVKKK